MREESVGVVRLNEGGSNWMPAVGGAFVDGAWRQCIGATLLQKTLCVEKAQRFIVV
jgi:hypothetical protein